MTALPSMLDVPVLGATAQAAGPSAVTAPAWRMPATALEAERGRRRLRAVLRRLFDGDWREVLLGMATAQHVYRPMERHDGRVDAYLLKVNLVRQACTLLTDMSLNQPPTLLVPADAEGQRGYLDWLHDAAMLDATIHQTLLTSHAEGVAHLLAGPDPATGRAAISLLDNDTVVPGPDSTAEGQPSVFERRWLVRDPAPSPRGSASGFRGWLRIERHRVVNRRAIVEQEAYAWPRDRRPGAPTPGDDLADTAALIPAPLAAVPGDERTAPLTVTESPVSLLTQVCVYQVRGEPRVKITRFDLDLLEETAAVLTQLSRAVALHANPKIRVTESMVDDKTGAVRGAWEAVVGDNDRVVSYIEVNFAFEAMLATLNKAVQLALGDLEVSPALLGMKMDAGAAPDTYDKLRLEATRTLAAIQRSNLFIAPALGMAITAASWIDATLPLAVNPKSGYAVSPVRVRLRPGLPRDQAQIIAEQSDLVQAGLTSVRQAVITIHGAENADEILSEIAADRAERVARERQALYLPPVETAPPTPPATPPMFPEGDPSRPPQPPLPPLTPGGDPNDLGANP